MARMRSVKPEFWVDRKLARKLSRDARLLYIALWNFADEHSRLRGDPCYIKGQVFPYDDDLGLYEIEKLLDEIEAAGRLARYEVDDDPYLFLPYLAKHQRLDTDKVPSRLPAPPETAGHEPDPDPSGRRADKSGRDPDEFAPRTDELSLKHVAGGMEHVAGSSPRAGAREAAAADASAECFDEWYAIYPKHTARADALKAFKPAAKKHGADFLIDQARRWAALWSDAGTDRQFIPYPATWLRGERWLDDPPRPRLRAVSGDTFGADRRQQATNDLFDRAMQRAAARMAERG